MTSSEQNSCASMELTNSLIAKYNARLVDAPHSIVAQTQSDTLSMVRLHQAAASIVARICQSNSRGTIVGVFAYPGFDLLAGMWGALLSGSAYCPLSPDYPEDRLRYMIEQSNMSTIVCEAGLEAELRDIAGGYVEVITPDFQNTSHIGNELPEPVQLNDLAYVIFTSGSTGRPKGVLIEHGNIARQMSWLHESFDLGGETTILQKTPFSFDAAQWELLSSAFGAKLIFGSQEGYRNPFEQVRLIQKFDVTMLQCVPTLWRALLETEQLENCTSLTKIFSGGEALSRELARDCVEALPGAEMTNLYGPTECTINASSFKVTQSWLSTDQHTAPIGTAVAGTDLVILDDDGSEVTEGEVGELHISGAQVGRGYLGSYDETTKAFLSDPADPCRPMYKTGDLAKRNSDGTVQFVSRIDGQVKVRGYWIELDEIRNAIENHDWVKTAGVFVEKNPNTGADALIGCVELSPNQAQLMDAGDAGDHHRSKSNKLQVKAQLSGLGLRTPVELAAKIRVDLPGYEAAEHQTDLAFARKSYRHFEGSKPVSTSEITEVLKSALAGKEIQHHSPVTLQDLGTMLRYFGQFSSPERLLPKYAYASPGALYATQIYLLAKGHDELTDGVYYLHPVEHALYRVAPPPKTADAGLQIQFIGKSRAISDVYKLNVREVLDFEVGHILGLFDEILPGFGMAVGTPHNISTFLSDVGANQDDHYLGGFRLATHENDAWQGPQVTAYLQRIGNGILDVDTGFHELTDRGLLKRDDKVIERNHVIAINQKVFERSQFGIGLCTPGLEGHLAYVALGRAMQRLQMNDGRLGFMSSGYSSASGHDLRTATRFYDLVGERKGAFYFCVGGRISSAQISHRGMKEDSVHSKGPLELIKDDLRSKLPDYMVPNHVVLVDQIPMSANGKLDKVATRALIDLTALHDTGQGRAPRNGVETEIARHWSGITGSKKVSIVESFFEAGGDSLGAVKLIMSLNEAFDVELPLEIIFEAATIEALAKLIETQEPINTNRLVELAPGVGEPIFCWPGLGGYPMCLRALARELSQTGRAIMGVQAYGLNPQERSDDEICAMAARDVAEIRRHRPSGPYTLIGYSFGARIAYETAYQLEAAGEIVDNLFLIAPGSPRLRQNQAAMVDRRASFDNPEYVSVLISVFTRQLGGPELVECLDTVEGREEFKEFAKHLAGDVPLAVVERITEVAIACFNTTYRPHELTGHNVQAPITVLKAAGDDPSFIEDESVLSEFSPNYLELPCDHYRLLFPDGVDMLCRHIISQLDFLSRIDRVA